jgi:uncharacterized protein (DUF362 family)/Pyruvate/2-oxoacid:ferredoxin oxidoreductase delta subunit
MIKIRDDEALTLKVSEETLSQAVQQVYDRIPLNFTGKSVLIKPNILGGFAPEKGITTHPLLVKAVLEETLRRGAGEVVVGDNPGIGGYGGNIRAGEGSGIAQVCGEHFINLGDNPIKTPLKSKFVKWVYISEWVHKADIIINLPRFKTHTLTQLTGGIKNTFGYVPGGMKAYLHTRGVGSKNFSELMVDIFALRPPDLTIVDGLTAMEGEGPSSDKLRPLGLLISSQNAVSVDVVMAKIMNISPMKVFQIKYAVNQGFINPGNFKIHNNYPVFDDYDIPLGLATRLGSIVVNALGFQYIHPTPYIDEKTCTRCFNCIEVCPTGALEDFPEVDDDKCISCYCCQEVCEVNAVKVSGFVYNIIRGKRD